MNLNKGYEEYTKKIDARANESIGSVKGVTRRVRFARVAFVVFAVVFAICVTLQVFIAGLAVFVTPVHWASHRSFVHFFEFLPLVMLVLSLLGRLPRAMHWQSAGLFGLIFVQYFTANIGAILPWVAAAHPVVALVLFLLSIRIVPKAWQLAAR